MPLVRSSAIRRIEYDEASMQLHVTFIETGTYTYHEVPKAVYEAFLSAESKGRFFNDYIRDCYPY